MKVLMVASEAHPAAKTGGLADVVYALAKQLTIAGVEVAIVLPYYQTINKKEFAAIKKVKSFDVFMSWRRQDATIYRTYLEGITYYFIGSSYYFNRDNLYGYYDDGERFAFFTLAVRNMIGQLNCRPNIVHIHDWQAGMLPTLIKEQNKDDPIYNRIKFVTTIHNPAFQGLLEPYLLEDFYGLSYQLFSSGKLRFKGTVSSLKGAIIESDKITTVSPTHAKELLTEEGGYGLNHVLQYVQDDFIGIKNGIDYDLWNPETDELIFQKYNLKDVYTKKKVNKKQILKKFNLKENNQPLFGLVSRLTWQKGVDLLIPAAYLIAERGGSLIVLGSGEGHAEQEFKKLQLRYPDRIHVQIGYSEPLAHQIYAASDFFLMPSLFEPCGISQMICLRYGTVPIVRMTGGLIDTVYPYTEENKISANGFGFYDYTSSAFNDTILWAWHNYYQKETFKQIISNGMQSLNDWTSAAYEYLKLYESLINEP